MSDQDWMEALRKKAPDVEAAFDRARKGLEEETERPEPSLEYTPPEPAPGGTMERRRPLVSPQLRRDLEKAKLKETIKRAFARAARDAVER